MFFPTYPPEEKEKHKDIEEIFQSLFDAHGKKALGSIEELQGKIDTWIKVSPTDSALVSWADLLNKRNTLQSELESVNTKESELHNKFVTQLNITIEQKRGILETLKKHHTTTIWNSLQKYQRVEQKYTQYLDELKIANTFQTIEQDSRYVNRIGEGFKTSLAETADTIKRSIRDLLFTIDMHSFVILMQIIFEEWQEENANWKPKAQRAVQIVKCMAQVVKISGILTQFL